MAAFTDTALYTIQLTRDWETMVSYTSYETQNVIPIETGFSTVGNSAEGTQYAGSDAVSNASDYGNSTDWMVSSMSCHSEEGGTYSDNSVGFISSYQADYTASESVFENTGNSYDSNFSDETTWYTNSVSGSSAGDMASGTIVTSHQEFAAIGQGGDGVNAQGFTQEGSIDYTEAAAASVSTYTSGGSTLVNGDSSFVKTFGATTVSSGDTTNSASGTFSTSTTFDSSSSSSTTAQESYTSGGTFESEVSSSWTYVGDSTLSSSTSSSTEITGSLSATQSGTLGGLPIGSYILNGSGSISSTLFNSWLTTNDFTFVYPTSTLVSGTITTTTGTSTYSNVAVNTVSEVRTFAAQTQSWVDQDGFPFEVYDASYVVPADAVAWVADANASALTPQLLQDIASSVTDAFEPQFGSYMFSPIVVVLDSDTDSTTATYEQDSYTTSSMEASYVGSGGSESSVYDAAIAGVTGSTQQTTGGTTLLEATTLTFGSLSNSTVQSTYYNGTAIYGTTTTSGTLTLGGLQYNVATVVPMRGAEPVSVITSYAPIEVTTTAYAPAVGTDGRWSGMDMSTVLTSSMISYTVRALNLGQNSIEGSNYSFYDGITASSIGQSELAGLQQVIAIPTILRPQRPAGVASPLGYATDRTPNALLRVGGADFPWPFGIGQQDGVSSPLPVVGSYSRQDPALTTTVVSTTAGFGFTQVTTNNSASHSYTASWTGLSILMTEAVLDTDNTSSFTITYSGVLTPSGADNHAFYLTKAGSQLGGWSPDGRDWLAIFPAGAVDSSNLTGTDDGSVATIGSTTLDLAAGSGMTGYASIPAYLLLPTGESYYTILPRYESPS